MDAIPIIPSTAGGHRPGGGAGTAATAYAARDRGSASVEFAITVPLVAGAALFGLALLWTLFLHLSAAHAAREGARFASVALAPTFRAHPSAAAVAAHIRDRVPVLRLGPADVEVRYLGCPVPCTDPPSNTPLEVTVRRTLPAPLRLLTTDGTITARASGEVRSE